MRQLIILLLAGWLIFDVVQTVRYITADYTQLPVMEWAEHNEHGMVFPELVYLADMLLLRGRMYLPIALSGVCYVGVWLVLVWAAYSKAAIEAPVREVALLVAGSVIAWRGCSSAIATPFLLQITMVQVLVTVAMGRLAKVGETGKWKDLGVVIAAAVVSTYSSGNGMLLWPVLIAGAALLKFSKSQITTLAAAAAVSISMYFYRYHALPDVIKATLLHPVYGFEFVCSYLSVPFGYSHLPLFGVFLGAANLLAMGVCATIAWRRGLMASRLGLVVFGSYVFIVLSAALTAVGRMDVNDPQFAEATPWRYVTMPITGWGLVAFAIVWIAGEARANYWAFVTVLLLGEFFGRQSLEAKRWVESTRADAQNGQITATMMRNNLFDAERERTVFPDPAFVNRYVKVLREDHKSVWARGEDRWIGQDAGQLPLESDLTVGRITRVYPIEGGLEILGWAESNSLIDDHEILFVDDSKKIVGFGRRPAAGMPGNMTTWDTPSALSFVGYVSLAKPVETLTVYVGRDHGRHWRPMEGKIPVPTFTVYSGASNSALAGMEWQPDPSWTLKGYPAGTEHGRPPSGDAYGSWSDGPDSRTGDIHSAAFAAPADPCLVLPVLHGTGAYGQSVAVRDADSKQPIATLPIAEGRSIWERWRIPIPEASRSVEIVAEDQGTGVDQWLAVGTPEHCR